MAMTDAPDHEDHDAPGPVVYDDNDLWKKWHRRGFCAVTAWHERGMVAVDVGEVHNGKLIGATKCFVNPIELVAWLRHRNPTGPTEAREFVHYGGGHTKENGTISRILKITGAAPEEGHLPTYWIKTGHFAASRSAQGAFIPDMKQPLSVNSIKATELELAELQVRLELLLTGWAASSSTWITETKKRD